MVPILSLVRVVDHTTSHGGGNKVACCSMQKMLLAAERSNTPEEWAAVIHNLTRE